MCYISSTLHLFNRAPLSNAFDQEPQGEKHPDNVAFLIVFSRSLAMISRNQDSVIFLLASNNPEFAALGKSSRYCFKPVSRREKASSQPGNGTDMSAFARISSSCQQEGLFADTALDLT